MTKLWPLPLRTNPMPTPSSGSEILELPKTRKSKNNKIHLGLPSNQKFHALWIYLQHYSHVNKTRLIQILPSVLIFPPLSTWITDIHWMARTNCNCCPMTPSYLKSNNQIIKWFSKLPLHNMLSTTTTIQGK